MLAIISALFLHRRACWVLPSATRLSATKTIVPANVCKWVENYANRFYIWGGARNEYTKSIKSDIQSLTKQSDNLAANVLSVAEGEKIKLIHIGQMPQGFMYLEELVTPTYIPTWSSFEELILRVDGLPDESFDVVCLGHVLSELTSPDQRMNVMISARRLIRNPGFGDQHPHRSGMMFLLEKDDVFADDNIQTAVFTRSAKRSYNKELLSDWRAIISTSGFNLLRYQVLDTMESENSNSTIFTHAFVASAGLFSHKPELILQEANSNIGDVLSCGQNEGRKEYFGGAYSVPKLWCMTDFKNQLNSLKHSEIHNEVTTNQSFAPRLKTSSSLPLPVAVIGGGLGGAALALALRRKGIPVVVFEKDTSFASRRQGYALTMQQGNSALRQLGIPYEALDGLGATSFAHTSLNAAGSVLGSYSAQAADHRITPQDFANGVTDIHAKDRIEVKAVSTDQWGCFAGREVSSNLARCNRRHNVHLPRQSLRELLLKQPILPGLELEQSAVDSKISERAVDSFRWGKKLQSLTDIDRNCIRLTFDDGTTFDSSVVVAADGIHSVVRTIMCRKLLIRNQLGPLSKPLTFLGLIVILGISPTRLFCNLYDKLGNRKVDLNRRSIQWLDGHSRIFTMPYDSSNTMWQLSFPYDEEASIQIANKGSILKRLALETLKYWDSPVVELVERTDVNDISGHPVYDRDPLTGEDIALAYGQNSRITLLGDAAHPMSPFKGQGANQALLDAVSLARNLASSEACRSDRRPVSEALREYEREMCLRSRNKVLGSRAAAAYLHCPDALACGDISRSAAAEYRRRSFEKQSATELQ